MPTSPFARVVCGLRALGGRGPSHGWLPGLRPANSLVHGIRRLHGTRARVTWCTNELRDRRRWPWSEGSRLPAREAEPRSPSPQGRQGRGAARHPARADRTGPPNRPIHTFRGAQRWARARQAGACHLQGEPPSLGPHPIRIAKLAKYLPDSGWQPTLLTSPADHAWYVDHELTGDLDNTSVVRVSRLLATVAHPTAGVARSETRHAPRQRPLLRLVTRVRSALARMLLIPDGSILWALPAARKASRMAHSVDAVLTTGPPFSTHLVGAYLRRRHRLPWVAEYRDNWTANPLYRRNRLVHWLNVRLERHFHSSASAIVVVSRAAAEELCAQFPGIADRVFVAANGFDPDDLPDPGPPSVDFEIVHAGTLDERRDPRPFFEALRQAIERDQRSV